MTETNRVQFVTVRESTFGTTPNTPRMRLARFSGEGLKYTPKFIQPDEIRSDRMNVLPVKVNEDNQGPINGEFSYPDVDSPRATSCARCCGTHGTTRTTRDNDGTADSVVTDVAPPNTVVTCTTGTAFVAGQLVKFSGFTNSATTAVFKCTPDGDDPFVGVGITAKRCRPPPRR
jgi:hypothetical protein